MAAVRKEYLLWRTSKVLVVNVASIGWNTEIPTASKDLRAVRYDLLGSHA